MSERGSGSPSFGGLRLGRRQFLAGGALASAGLLLAGPARERRSETNLHRSQQAHVRPDPGPDLDGKIRVGAELFGG